MQDIWWWTQDDGLILQLLKYLQVLSKLWHANLQKFHRKSQFHSTLRTIPTEKDSFITDLKIGDCIDAMGHAQIKFALEKQLFFWPTLESNFPRLKVNANLIEQKDAVYFEPEW